MKKFWSFIVGVYIIAVILYGIGQLFSPWIFVGIPVTLIALYFYNGINRYFSLRHKGYFAGRLRGDQVVYEERGNSETHKIKLNLENTEHGHYELFIPTAQEWCVVAPVWTMNRRQEIITRITLSKCLKESDIHYPNDWVKNA
ncbi:MAG TPA: hypothetical protein PKZ37_16700 [Gallionellaceae bacterium]|nr:hypothetical protein [Gallionellaceae bacterium]